MCNQEDDPFVGAVLTGLHAAVDPFDGRICLKCIEALSDVRTRLQILEKELKPGANVILAGFDFPAELTDPLVKKGIRVLTIGRPEDERIPFVHSDYRKSMLSGFIILTGISYLTGGGRNRTARGPSRPLRFLYKKRGIYIALDLFINRNIRKNQIPSFPKGLDRSSCKALVWGRRTVRRIF